MADQHEGFIGCLMNDNIHILVRGAGDFAGVRFASLNQRVYKSPRQSFRSPLQFDEAQHFRSSFKGRIEIEGVTAKLSTLANFENAISHGFVPIVMWAHTPAAMSLNALENGMPLCRWTHD